MIIMAWYYILLIVLASVLVFTFILLFIIYITNADLKLVEKIYDKLVAYHDKNHTESKL